MSVYLDHNATTPLDPEVLLEMMPFLTDAFGNPSSVHSFGREARRAIDVARARAAALIGAQPDEILFTGSGTEADNLAILGSADLSAAKRCVVTTSVEHHAVLNPCRRLERSGGRVTFLSVNRDGVIGVDAARESIGNDTAAASIMLANNVTGVVQPVTALSKKARATGTLLHSDAVQAVGKMPVDVRTLGVDLLSFSAHKINGPKGVGALFVRRGVALSPVFSGGRQERGLRPGTENVAAIAGFGRACELAALRLDENVERISPLRSLFEVELLERIPGVTINGAFAPRVCGTTSVSFDHVDGDALVIRLDLLGVAASSGAACNTLDREPSHVLLAMGRSEEEARSSVRFSFGRGNTAEEIVRVVGLIARTVAEMRGGAM